MLNFRWPSRVDSALRIERLFSSRPDARIDRSRRLRRVLRALISLLGGTEKKLLLPMAAGKFRCDRLIKHLGSNRFLE
jgi:hypothetical protein